MTCLLAVARFDPRRCQTLAALSNLAKVLTLRKVLYIISLYLKCSEHESFVTQKVILIVCSVLVLPACRLYSQVHPYRIDEITIVRRHIFDTTDAGEKNFIGPLANSFHWLTKERVIRNELLFSEYDTYDPALLHETERNLRNLGFVGNISTRVDTTSDSTVRIEVHTQDKWTLGVSPSYQQGGGVESFGFTTKDDNFLGNGQSVSVGYDHHTDRSNPHGIETIFSERHLMGTRWATRLQYKNSESLRLTSASFDRPYYSDEARWVANFYTDYSDIRIPYYQNGTRVQENIIGRQLQTAFYSSSFGDELKWRPAIGIVRIHSSGPYLRSFDNLDLLNVSMNVMRRTYHERVFVDNHGRIEDVPEGILGNILVGRNFHLSHPDGPDYYLQANWLYSIAAGDFYYVSSTSSLNTYLGGTGHRETTLDGTLLQYMKPQSDQTLVARLSGTFGIDWSPERQMYLGTSNGLRGYNNFAFAGQHRLVYTLEYRYFSPASIWIFRPGATAFIDGGTIWDQDDNIRNQRFHHSVGLGLQIENTKQQGSGSIRIDLAYNADERRFAGIIISSGVFFSAFQDIGFISPVATGDF